uniref:Uncharacterized protein n=1 Tax=Amphora coffeiformis TaxID=265554 RepID=A0A7S3L6V5_9STRA
MFRTAAKRTIPNHRFKLSIGFRSILHASSSRFGQATPTSGTSSKPSRVPGSDKDDASAISASSIKSKLASSACQFESCIDHNNKCGSMSCLEYHVVMAVNVVSIRRVSRRLCTGSLSRLFVRPIIFAVQEGVEKFQYHMWDRP